MGGRLHVPRARLQRAPDMRPRLSRTPDGGRMSMYELYGEPSKVGLEIVAELDTGGSYDFDKVVVWRRKIDGAYLWLADSGCSCPSPFEDYGVDDLKSLTGVGDPAFEAAIVNASQYAGKSEAIDFRA